MQPDFSLSGKTLLITGASSGIGRGIALACSAAGAKVILLARDQARLEATAAACGGALEICSRDLSRDVDALPQLVRDLAKRHGPVTGLVHSAGVMDLAPLRALRPEMAMDMFRVNALAGVMLVKGLALSKHSGVPAAAVMLSSVAAKRGAPAQIAYCMAKGALESATRALAMELIPDNIRVNAVAPALIETEMTEQYKSLGEGIYANLLKKHPMGEGKPEDVAAAVVFLLSDASRYVNGTTLLVDGGYCA